VQPDLYLPQCLHAHYLAAAHAVHQCLHAHYLAAAHAVHQGLPWIFTIHSDDPDY
jgi:hypothetical protein